MIGIILSILVRGDPIALALPAAGRPSLHQGAVFTGLEATLQGLAHARRPRRSTLARCHRRLARSGGRRRCRCRRRRRSRGRNRSSVLAASVHRFATLNDPIHLARASGLFRRLLRGLLRLLLRRLSTLLLLLLMMMIRAAYRPAFGGGPGVEARALTATGRHGARRRRKRSRGGGICWPAMACESHGFGERSAERSRARDRSSTACRLRLPSDD